MAEHLLHQGLVLTSRAGVAKALASHILERALLADDAFRLTKMRDVAPEFALGATGALHSVGVLAVGTFDADAETFKGELADRANIACDGRTGVFLPLASLTKRAQRVPGTHRELKRTCCTGLATAETSAETSGTVIPDRAALATVARGSVECGTELASRAVDARMLHVRARLRGAELARNARRGWIWGRVLSRERGRKRSWDHGARRLPVLALGPHASHARVANLVTGAGLERARNAVQARDLLENVVILANLTKSAGRVGRRVVLANGAIAAQGVGGIGELAVVASGATPRVILSANLPGLAVNACSMRVRSVAAGNASVRRRAGRRGRRSERRGRGGTGRRRW